MDTEMSDVTLFKYKGILRLATWAELLAHINCHFQLIKSKKNTVWIKIHAIQLHFHFKTALQASVCYALCLEKMLIYHAKSIYFLSNLGDYLYETY